MVSYMCQHPEETASMTALNRDPFAEFLDPCCSWVPKCCCRRHQIPQDAPAGDSDPSYEPDDSSEDSLEEELDEDCACGDGFFFFFWGEDSFSDSSDDDEDDQEVEVEGFLPEDSDELEESGLVFPGLLRFAVPFLALGPAWAASPSVDSSSSYEDSEDDEPVCLAASFTADGPAFFFPLSAPTGNSSTRPRSLMSSPLTRPLTISSPLASLSIIGAVQ
ncbi:hypothetical protein BSKO_08948 [Bryopsis sp. KO-2023]|nr:hypothetical protein BSKO_06617 [Bryopsis sp. KO-2023]GMH41038.1 hypothetical protein BSKO_08948 [Bryopsis sp. KO-2023]